jgi:hypothetical protein
LPHCIQASDTLALIALSLKFGGTYVFSRECFMSAIAAAVTIFYFLALFGVGSAFAIDSLRATFSRPRQRPNYLTDSARFEDELLSTVAAPTVGAAAESSGSARVAEAA